MKWESSDKKYTVIFYPDGKMEALRYGQPWQDLTGNGLILSMLQALSEPDALQAAAQPVAWPSTPLRARKIGGNFQADGWLVGQAVTRGGLRRLVFEFDAFPMLHIYTPEQLEIVVDGPGAFASVDAAEKRLDEEIAAAGGIEAWRATPPAGQAAEPWGMVLADATFRPLENGMWEWRGRFLPPSHAGERSPESLLYEQVGREMVAMTTTVHGPDEWMSIPAIWQHCMEERDAALAKLVGERSTPAEPIATVTADRSFTGETLGLRWLTNGRPPAGTKLYATPPSPQPEEGEQP